MKMFSKLTTALMFFVLAIAPAFAQTNYGKFTATTPVPMTAAAPTQGTTTAGATFTTTIYSATLPNTDVYMVAVAEYPFTVQHADLDRDVNGFVASLKGTLLSQRDVATASGEPATIAAISAKDETGRELRVALVVSYKGNKAYQFVFISYLDVKSDSEAFKAFFSNLRIN
jgi:hypothetical protein